MAELPPDLTANGSFIIDSYTLTKRVGAGAMGEVYLATEAITNRDVAVKMMHARIQSDPTAKERFRKEIDAVATLHHPNIAMFAGHGEWKGMPYMVMELVKGIELGDFVRGGATVNEEVALFLIIQVAEALEYAHQRTGMIHRDIKPGNIILDLSGSATITTVTKAKIIDFGLANFRALLDQEFTAGDLSMHEVAEDLVGQTVGTPAYMPPEQVRGDGQITFAADIYSLAATLYHLVTGAVPYPAKNPSLTMVAHLQDPVPDPSKLVPTLRSSTRDLVMRGMAKDPIQRHKSWDQFINAARAALKTVQTGTVRITARHVQSTAPRNVRLEESARFVRRALGDVKPGAMTGAEALSQLLARRVQEQSDRDNPFPS